KIYLNGSVQVIGGTSAVAPLWAGLITGCVAGGVTSGSLFSRLYGNASAFNDVIQGNNGAYQAGPGYDLCTGLGAPHGTAILAALMGGVIVSPPPPPPPAPPPPVPTGHTFDDVMAGLLASANFFDRGIYQFTQSRGDAWLKMHP